MKKFISLILAVTVILSVFCGIDFSANAENAPQTDFPICSEDISLSGTNAVGNMLAKEFEDVSESQQNSGNVIFSVEVENDTAYTDFSTAVAGTLFVGIYTEDMKQMLTSAYTNVTADDEQATLEFTDTLPDYFYIKAFLVDTEDYTPLSAVYQSAMYTKEMQELLASTTEDYEEDRVINFDDDITNNFAVLSEDVTVIEDEDKNVPTYVDTNSDIYMFENINEKIISLKADDAFSFEYNGDTIVVKVGEISVEGTNATILGQDAELDEVFDYVKLDGKTGIDENTVDPSTCPDGVTFDGYESQQTPKKMLKAISIDPSIGFDAKFSFQFVKKGSDNANVTVAGNIKLKAVFAPKLYIAHNYKYIELKFDYSIGGSVSVTGKVEFSTPLSRLTFGVPGVRAEFTPDLVGSASGSIEISGTLLKGTVGYGWYSDVGGASLTTTPKMEAELKLEVTVFIGLRIDPEIKIAEGLLADVKLESNLGGEYKGRLAANTSDIFSSSKIHDCKACIKGEIYGKFDLSIKGKLLNNEKWKLSFKLLEIKLKLWDCYYSIDYNEFAFTTCPHISYKLTVNVTDENGKVMKDATVNFNNKNYSTDNNGSVSDFLKNGNYTVTVTAKDYKTASKSVTIKDAKKTLNIKLSKTSADLQNSTLSLGGNHTGVITENGDLYMWGSNNFGQIGDGTYDDRPTPKKILSNVKSASLGYQHTGAITENGDLYMWGLNGSGQLGDGTYDDRPTPKKILSNVKSVSLGAFHSAAITENGDLYMWGYNYFGQIGDGTTTDCYTPKKIISNVKSVSLGYYHTGAITESGDLYMWGYNYFGQIGDGTKTTRTTPKKILSNVKSVSLGESHTGVITENGDLYMWGYNYFGQIGDGTYDDRTTPTKITLPAAVKLSAPFKSAKLFSAEPESISIFEGLTPNTVYNFYIMKDKKSETPFKTDNLFYIDQGITDQNGNLTFNYAQQEKYSSAQKFVVAFENRLPDEIFESKAITADKDTVYLHINHTKFEDYGYENIRAKFEISGISAVSSAVRVSDTDYVISYKPQSGLLKTDMITVTVLADYGSISYTAKKMTANVEDARCDTNADGAVNAYDLIDLRKILLCTTDLSIDTNGDGVLNISDLIHLKKAFAG